MGDWLKEMSGKKVEIIQKIEKQLEGKKKFVETDLYQ